MRRRRSSLLLPSTPAMARIRCSTASTIPWRPWASTPCSPCRRGMASPPSPIRCSRPCRTRLWRRKLCAWSRHLRRCSRMAACRTAARCRQGTRLRRIRMPAPTVMAMALETALSRPRAPGARLLRSAAGDGRKPCEARRRALAAASRRRGARASGAGVRSVAWDAASRGLSRRRPQAWPASLTRCEGSMPILASARAYLASRLVSKMRSGSAGQLSQPFAWISLSSCPGDQPA